MTALPSTLQSIVYKRLTVPYRDIGRECIWNKYDRRYIGTADMSFIGRYIPRAGISVDP